MNTVPALHSAPVSPFAWAMVGALAATALDLTFASVYWVALHDVPPVRIMQAIAAYWGWGPDAYAGGTGMAVLGASLFFARMILLAVIYQAAARRFAALIERPYAWGALFGLAIYLSNQYVVVPLIGAMPPKPAFNADWLWVSSCIVSHVLLIGIPLALSARAAARGE